MMSFLKKSLSFLKLRKEEFVSWTGKFSAKPKQSSCLPEETIQNPLPVWLGAGGTMESCIRAGKLGLPLMLAIIGGQTARFRPQADAYKKAAQEANKTNSVKLGMHSICYVHKDSDTAKRFLPGYLEVFSKIGKERGWPPVNYNFFKNKLNQVGHFLLAVKE